MWTPRNLKLNTLHYSPVNVNGGLFGPPFPIVHDQLLCLAHIEGEVVVLASHPREVKPFTMKICEVILDFYELSLKDMVLKKGSFFVVAEFT